MPTIYSKRPLLKRHPFTRSSWLGLAFVVCLFCLLALARADEEFSNEDGPTTSSFINAATSAAAAAGTTSEESTLSTSESTPSEAGASTSSTNNDNNKPIRMVLVPKSMDNPFFDPSGDGCVDQAALLSRANAGRRPVECRYYGPGPAAADNQGKIQAQIVSDMVDAGEVDALSISVRNSDVMTPVIDKAVAAGIPVVTFDSDAPTSQRSAYVGTDNFFFGTQIAKVLKQLEPEGGTYGLITSAESVNLQERVAGFIYEMEREHEKYTWTQVEGSPADIIGDIHIAMDKMHELANAPVPPTAIAPVMGAPMRSGTWKEFVDEHRDKNITLVAGDAMPNQLDFLSRRYCHGLVGQLPYEMGAISAQILYDLITTGQPVTEEIVGTNVLTHIQVPLILPKLTVDHNLIGSLNVIGYILFGIVSVMAIGFAAWVWRARNVHVVKVAQPYFLVMVAVGVLVMASALIPLSFDDGGEPASQSELEGILICMSIPWLASLGFTITFSALFSKTWRVNKIFRQAKGFTRVRVKAKDVLVPFLVLFSANVLLLTLWTILDPLRYVRQDLPGTDGWNRVISTYGSCKSEKVVYFLTPLAVLNISVLVLANYQAYQARLIESEFAESKYIGMAMASLLQAMVSGIPILFVVRESPQAYYLVLAFMIFIICCAVLLLIFIPKMMLADKFSNSTEKEQQQHIMSVIRSTNAGIQAGHRTSSQRHLVSGISTHSKESAPDNVVQKSTHIPTSSSLRPSSQASDDSTLPGGVGVECHPSGAVMAQLKRYIVDSDYDRPKSSFAENEEVPVSPASPPRTTVINVVEKTDTSVPPATETMPQQHGNSAADATKSNNDIISPTAISNHPNVPKEVGAVSDPIDNDDSSSSLDDDVMRDRLMNRLGAIQATKKPTYFM